MNKQHNILLTIGLQYISVWCYVKHKKPGLPTMVKHSIRHWSREIIIHWGSIAAQRTWCELV